MTLKKLRQLWYPNCFCSLWRIVENSKTPRTISEEVIEISISLRKKKKKTSFYPSLSTFFCYFMGCTLDLTTCIQKSPYFLQMLHKHLNRTQNVLPFTFACYVFSRHTPSYFPYMLGYIFHSF